MPPPAGLHAGSGAGNALPKVSSFAAFRVVLTAVKSQLFVVIILQLARFTAALSNGRDAISLDHNAHNLGVLNE
jgi:hypothetical protein